MNILLRRTLFICVLMIVSPIFSQDSSLKKPHKDLIKIGGGKLFNNTSTTDLDEPLTPTGYRIDVNNPAGLLGSYAQYQRSR